MISINGKVIEIGHYPDGTLNLQLSNESMNPLIIDKEGWIDWYYDKEEELIALIYLVNKLRNKGVCELTLHMPYVPNARMDRCESNYDVFTLKYFSNIINSLQFRNVATLDVHSTVTEALIDNISNERRIL